MKGLLVPGPPSQVRGPSSGVPGLASLSAWGSRGSRDRDQVTRGNTNPRSSVCSSGDRQARPLVGCHSREHKGTESESAMSTVVGTLRPAGVGFAPKRSRDAERAACQVRGCTQTPTGHKPYCIEHLDELPYVQWLKSELARRDEDAHKAAK